MSRSHRLVAALGLCAAVAFAGPSRAAVVVSEIHYHPPGDKDLEFVEVHNTGPAAVDLDGWEIQGAALFTFPAPTRLEAGAYLAICRSVDAVRAAYELSGEATIGGLVGSLANEGERIGLVDAAGKIVEVVEYDDALPWDFLADGFGASLERLCMTAPASDAANWRAGSVPSELGASGGSPGRANDRAMCPPLAAARPPVFISEIHYHPVLEESLEDDHEFVEIHNGGAQAIALSGWRLAGGIDFTFPAGTVIEPGAYRVIAADRARLAAVAAYGLVAGDLLGDYKRRLDNGGERVALIGADGQGVDIVSYDDDFPWPIAADALGAGVSWLRSELLPLEEHRYLGHSLERIRFDVAGTEVANWSESPLDGPTPGKANASARASLLPIVEDIDIEGASALGAPIAPDANVRIRVRFTPAAPAGAVEVEHFVEDVNRSNETVERLALRDDGAAGIDAAAGDLVYSGILPPRPVNAIVRYRIAADRGAGIELVSPRPTDPNPWRAYFVPPAIVTETRVYHVFISSANWGRMWTNVQSGRVSGCNESPTWDQPVDAIFVHEDQVFDAHVRYQGSRWNRSNGRDITVWPYPRPSAGSLRALSWRIALPRYNQLEGRGVVTLNKLNQGCPGYNSGVGYRLFALADIPSPETRFARLHVNGGYYHYMMEYERPGEEMLRRYNREMAEKYPEREPEKYVGDLYKSVGCNCDEGPFSWGDARRIQAACGHSKETRYAYTYGKKTNDWAGNAPLVKIIEDLNVARTAGTAAIRQYFEDNWDLELLMNYIAIINYSVPFDDMFQNHFWYQRASDGRWMLTPWDLDRNFGEYAGATSSIFCGELGDSSNRSGWWHYLKDAFLKAYRDEFRDHLVYMNNTILHPDRIGELVDLVTAESNPAEAAQAPSGVACSFPGRISSFKSFAVARFNHINQLSGISIQAGSDLNAFVGEPVVLDASPSVPDPDADVRYSWIVDGETLEGERHTVSFDEVGEYVATLQVDVRGLPFEDSVTITVLPAPDRYFLEKDGLLVVEAESFHANERFGAENTFWEARGELPGFSGNAYAEAVELARQTWLSRYIGLAPEIRYAVRFETPGSYRVWIRALARSNQNDTMYVSLDGENRPAADAHSFEIDAENILWSGNKRNDVPQILEVPAAGLHYISVWIRESGTIIDKIVMASDEAFVPQDLGPPQSAQEVTGGNPLFVRGDASGNGRLEISDPVGILRHLFAGEVVVACDDHGDANDDGRMNLTDAVYLLEFIFRRGAPPPAPFPLAGSDSTADGLGCGD